MLSGRSVLVVEALEAAIFVRISRKHVSNRPAVQRVRASSSKDGLWSMPKKSKSGIVE